jgi:hypothetical protein
MHSRHCSVLDGTAQFPFFFNFFKFSITFTVNFFLKSA